MGLEFNLLALVVEDVTGSKRIRTQPQYAPRFISQNDIISDCVGLFFEVGSNNLSLAITNTLLGLMGAVMFVFIFMKGKHIVLLRALLVSLLIVVWLVNLFAGAGFFFWFAPLFMAAFYIATYGDARFTPTAFSKYFPPDRNE